MRSAVFLSSSNGLGNHLGVGQAGICRRGGATIFYGSWIIGWLVKAGNAKKPHDPTEAIAAATDIILHISTMYARKESMEFALEQKKLGKTIHLITSGEKSSVEEVETFARENGITAPVVVDLVDDSIETRILQEIARW